MLSYREMAAALEKFGEDGEQYIEGLRKLQGEGNEYSDLINRTVDFLSYNSQAVFYLRECAKRGEGVLELASTKGPLATSPWPEGH